jgi:hypothetical protein
MTLGVGATFASLNVPDLSGAGLGLSCRAFSRRAFFFSTSRHSSR